MVDALPAKLASLVWKYSVMPPIRGADWPKSWASDARALVSPLPITWATVDSAHGQEWRFRRTLEEAGVGYVLAVPKSQHIQALGRIDFAIAQAPADAWECHSCGNGAKEARVHDWAAAQPPAIGDFDGTSPPINDEYWPDAACRTRRRSLTTPPTHRAKPPSLSWNLNHVNPP
ncbi:hypothetical protein ABZ537_46685 [Streptomyces umbrinus]